MVFLKDFFEKVDFEINQHHGKFSGGEELILLAVFCLPKIKVSSLRNYTGGAELYAHAFMRTHRYAPDSFEDLFFICVCLWHITFSVFCSLVFTCWERADL